MNRKKITIWDIQNVFEISELKKSDFLKESISIYTIDGELEEVLYELVTWSILLRECVGNDLEMSLVRKNFDMIYPLAVLTYQKGMEFYRDYLNLKFEIETLKKELQSYGK